MKKLFLASMFQNVSHLLKSVEEVKGKTVTFIPIASKVEKLGFFVKIGKWALRFNGMKVEELDIRTASHEQIKATLAKNDMIYIAGGNTFYLLQELRRSGADQLIIKEVERGKLYIGESAGAIVACPDIGYSTVMDDPTKAPELTDYKGLGLVDFYVVPHYQSREFKEASETMVRENEKDKELAIINDRQALWIKNDDVEILENSNKKS
ncbi:Type 1 glutamine amidotransferase-like domain-containing protein [Candidatus Enterococcus murrayae]|uniref:Type 1 glutamine amidotransferase-like domain-containing protein n=1 Tax=Candidatus Enterococcus murrayae TaxID=2815321 RepID=A0ABS3HNW3_9ENTE|nr:Type 1 glutamine amidotransferase-like domain-containing protein [Enterococcus sp. MJM16]MBO0454697.1 Type 1 glutamine amidotransferase-like domain-containing protein [Enterococcus sp. MJM16]